MQNSRIIYVNKYVYDTYSTLTITHPYFKLYRIPGQVSLRCPGATDYFIDLKSCLAYGFSCVSFWKLFTSKGFK